MSLHTNTSPVLDFIKEEISLIFNDSVREKVQQIIGEFNETWLIEFQDYQLLTNNLPLVFSTLKWTSLYNLKGILRDF